MELVCKLGDLNRFVVPQEELVVVLKNINQHMSVIPRMMFTQESSTKLHLAACSFELPMV